MPVIFSYCERTGPGFWAEPLNAVSNLAFVVAGVVVLRRLRRIAAPAAPVSVVVVLVGLLPVIGVGSFIFHTVAGWTRVLDEAPILVFVLSYLVVAVHLFLGAPWRLAWLAVPGYVLFASALGEALGRLGWRDPGVRYVPVLLAIVGLATALILSDDANTQRYGWSLAGGGVLFAVAFALRQLDQPLCPYVPTGTHFAWHLLNAVVLYLVVSLALSRWERLACPRPEDAAADTAKLSNRFRRPMTEAQK